jgi:hypothetical protein
MEPSQHHVHVPARTSVPGTGGAAGRRDRGRVRAIARAAGRTCSRSGCDTPAAATLVFSYADRVARLVDLLDMGEPQAYDLCPTHADRTSPPVGWELSDTRPPQSASPRRLEDHETVEVLAAALRGETPPTRVSVVDGGRQDDEPSPTGHAADVEVAQGTPEPPEPGDEDPLRAALEELQRIAAADDEPLRPATPLRPSPRAPRAATPPPPPPSETPDPTGPPPPPPVLATPPEQDEPTLW